MMIGNSLPELEHPQSQVVAAPIRLVIHKAVARQRAQQAIGGAERQAGAPGQISRTCTPRFIAQKYQQA
ncbi:hypothetical protein D3C86_2204260 [compost metagenome]